MLLLALFACSGSPDPETDAPNDDTDIMDDDVDTDEGEDSGTAGVPEWTALPQKCGDPAETDDPLTVVGSLLLQDFRFIETVDIEVDEETDIAWLVGQGGLISVDLSDPSAPEYLFGGGGQRFYQVELGPDNALYAANRDRGSVSIFDRTEPRGPTPHGQIDVAGPSGMAHTDDRLYLTTHAGELITYDITDPFAPQELSRVGGLENAWSPYLQGAHLYVADNSAGIITLSLADPDEPALIGVTATQGGAQDLTFSEDGQTMYVAVGGAGIEVFRLDDPSAPQSIGIEALNYSVISVSAGGDRLWAANQQDVVGYDISTPRSPVRINTERTPQWAMHVAAYGDRVAVSDWGYLHILDLDLAVAAPDIALVERAVYLEPDTTTEVRVRNLGNASMEILGAEAPPGRVMVEASTTTIEPDSEGRLRITNTTTDSAQSDVFGVCVATSDPDTPDQIVTILSAPPPNVGIGTDAPDFTLTGLDGETYTLSDQRGQPVVLAYFATW